MTKLQELEHRVLDALHSLPRRRVWLAVGAVSVAAFALWSLVSAVRRSFLASESLGAPHAIAPIQDVIRGKLEIRAWLDEHGKPLPCSGVYVAKDKATRLKIDGKIPEWVVRYEPGDPIRLDLGPGKVQAAISATGHVKRGELEFGGDIFNMRRVDGKPDFIVIDPRNPYLAWENEWRLSLLAGVTNDGNVFGGSVRWLPLSFRIKHVPGRGYPFLGAQAFQFHGETIPAGVTGLDWRFK